MMQLEQVQRELVDTVEDKDYYLVQHAIKREKQDQGQRTFLALTFSKSKNAPVALKRFLIPLN